MNDDDFQRLGEAVLNAGWAKTFVRQDQTIHFAWTEKGLDRMKYLYKCFQELNAEPVSNETIGVLRQIIFTEGNKRRWFEN